MFTYKTSIKSLKDNEIFVFGSNTQGRHGKGAALWAVKNAGAIYGQPMGFQGRSFAIITKDLTKSVHPSITIEQIKSQIRVLYAHARQHDGSVNANMTKSGKLYFIIAYSTKPNLNGYTPEQMAEMFREVGPIPYNIIFEEGFYKLVFNTNTTDNTCLRT